MTPEVNPSPLYHAALAGFDVTECLVIGIMCCNAQIRAVFSAKNDEQQRESIAWASKQQVRSAFDGDEGEALIVEVNRSLIIPDL